MSIATAIDIASKTATSKDIRDERMNGQVFDDYETAILKSKADLAYVSLVNSAHAYWVEKALETGRHVIVDKPAFTDIQDARRLVDLATKRNLCLAESTVYTYHPQIQLARDVFSRARSSPTRLAATFSFPPLSPNNFRYKKALGGGALWDLGPYAVTPGRIFFGQEPDQVFCRAFKDKGSEVDTSFSVLITYPQERSMVGHFGFNTEYRNHLNILGLGASVDIERVFTIPAEMENELRVRIRNENTVQKAPKVDTFLTFLRRVADAIQTDSHHLLARDLLADASTLHKLRTSALEGQDD
jgi:predicted dehydrogenase